MSDRLVTGLSHNVSGDKSLEDGTMAIKKKVSQPDHPVVVDMSGYEMTLETDYVLLASTHIIAKHCIGEESRLEIDGRNGGIVVNGAFESMNGLYVAGNLGCIDTSVATSRRSLRPCGE